MKLNPKTAKERHGMSDTITYLSWQKMRERVLNPDHASFDNYGRRGISICGKWDSFLAFLADVGERPSRAHTLDRIDGNGNYEPTNCRWATRNEQASNPSNRRLTDSVRATFWTSETARLARRAGRKKAADRSCAECGTPFSPRRMTSRFCSRRCVALNTAQLQRDQRN